MAKHSSSAIRPSVKYFLLLALLYLVFAIKCFGKNNICVFRQSNTAYVDLIDDTVITTLLLKNKAAGITNFNGQQISLYGRNYNIDGTSQYVAIMHNGRLYIQLDTGFAIFDGLNTSLFDSIDHSSRISYVVSGAAGKNILKVQWKNMHVNGGHANNYINMQIWYYQENGVVEFRYGPRSANNASGYNDPKKGLYIGIWLSNNDYSKVYEKMNLTGTPPTIGIDSALDISVPNILGVPEPNTIYRFIPKTIVTSVKAVNLPGTISVWPNPAKDQLIISGISEDLSFQNAIIVDISGKHVYEHLLIPGLKQQYIDISKLPAGPYQLILRRSTGSEAHVFNVYR